MVSCGLGGAASSRLDVGHIVEAHGTGLEIAGQACDPGAARRPRKHGRESRAFRCVDTTPYRLLLLACEQRHALHLGEIAPEHRLGGARSRCWRQDRALRQGGFGKSRAHREKPVGACTYRASKRPDGASSLP